MTARSEEIIKELLKMIDIPTCAVYKLKLLKAINRIEELEDILKDNIRREHEKTN